MVENTAEVKLVLEEIEILIKLSLLKLETIDSLLPEEDRIHFHNYIRTPLFNVERYLLKIRLDNNGFQHP